jgi:hypothetical protein
MDGWDKLYIIAGLILGAVVFFATGNIWQSLAFAALGPFLLAPVLLILMLMSVGIGSVIFEALGINAQSPTFKVILASIVSIGAAVSMLAFIGGNSDRDCEYSSRGSDCNVLYE